MTDTWYFAYGSNLDMEQKELRTGTIRELRRGRLLDYRLEFNKRAADGSAYANLVKAKGEVTWGVIYRCSPATLDTMDKYEGVSGGHYFQQAVEVTTDDGEILPAVTYIAGPRFLSDLGKPRPAYLKRVLDGARSHGLPDEYVRQIQARA